MAKRKKRVSIDSACVQTSISCMQAAIRQCIQSSMAYKQWCITLFAGLLVVSLVRNSDMILFIAGCVVGIFYLLDSANAAIRLRLQDDYRVFRTKVTRGNARFEDMFVVHWASVERWRSFRGLWELSRATFYLALVLVALLVGVSDAESLLPMLGMNL